MSWFRLGKSLRGFVRHAEVVGKQGASWGCCSVPFEECGGIAIIRCFDSLGGSGAGGEANDFEGVAQSVEQRPFKPWVQGSSPCTLILVGDFRGQVDCVVGGVSARRGGVRGCWLLVWWVPCRRPFASACRSTLPRISAHRWGLKGLVRWPPLLPMMQVILACVITSVVQRGRGSSCETSGGEWLAGTAGGSPVTQGGSVHVTVRDDSCFDSRRLGRAG